MNTTLPTHSSAGALVDHRTRTALQASPPPKRTSLKKAAVLSWCSLAVNTAAAFAVTPVIIAALGPAGFGAWALIQSFSGYYGIVNLGIGSALLRYVSHDLAVGNRESLHETISTTTAFFFATGVTVIGVVAALAFPAAGFFKVSAEQQSAFALTFIVTACAVVVDFFAAVNSTIFNAAERLDLGNIMNILRQVVLCTAVLVVMQVHPSIAWLAGANFAVGFLFMAAGTIITRRLIPERRFSMRSVRRARLKELLSYGGSSALLTVSNIARLRLANAVIAKMSTLAAVGNYSIAASLVTNFNQIIASTTNVLSAPFTRLHAQGNLTELRRLYQTALFATSALTCGIGTMMILFGGRFIDFWLGRSMPETIVVLNVLVLAYTVALAQAPSWNMMFALSKHHFMAKVAVYEAIANITVGVWLTNRLGAAGFALATAGSMLATKLFLQPVYSARIAGLTLAQYLRPMMIPMITAITVVAAARLSDLKSTLESSGALFFVLSVATWGSFYGLVVFVICRNCDYMPGFVKQYWVRLTLTCARLTTRTEPGRVKTRR